MSFKLNSLIAVAGLACALALPAGLSAQQSTAPAPAPANGGQGMGMSQSGGMQTKFPGLREAHMHLTAAQKALEGANFDYGDHKAKAMDLIKQAQQELEACKQYAQSHPQK